MTAQRLENHLLAQDHLRTQINESFAAIEQQYQQFGSLLKEELKEVLTAKLSYLAADKKLAITLVDIQNDFVLNGFALYANGGENTVTSNMSLLDAIEELLQENPALCNQIELVTSQDAHILGRTAQDRDAQIMARSSYGVEQTQKTIETEQNELAPFNPENGQFGLHCMRGTLGAAISQPIETRLRRLEAKIAVHRFGKINFSGPEAGMKLKDGIDISDPRFLSDNESIYDENALSYAEFFNNQHYADVFITGICGNVCVQQAAEGLAEQGKQVSVIDSCVHYLVIPGVSNYSEVRKAVQDSYAAKNIRTINLYYFPSNPECLTENEQRLIKIDAALHILTNKIGSVAHHEYNKAYHTALALLSSLNTSRDTYARHLETDDMSIAQAELLFKKECMDAIRIAHPILKNDLTWGPYIKNLLKIFANTLLHVISFGCYSGRFFTLAETQSDKAVKETKNNFGLNNANIEELETDSSEEEMDYSLVIGAYN